MTHSSESKIQLTPFGRRYEVDTGEFTMIGHGEIGGKAHGLAQIKLDLLDHLDLSMFPEFHVSIPTITVLGTDVFDHFMAQNDLYRIVLAHERDDEIGMAFQHASLPPDIIGDIRALCQEVHFPLAVRSSSLFEDSLHRPFAGVYGTKMIPNNQLDADTRFRVLVEAIKFVYASTFFAEARAYIAGTGESIENEKMAIIIQEVVGARHGDRYYPNFSGVARSYNYYRSGHAKAEDGVVNLALGLGKTIVDGGVSWSYSPAYPNANPPYKSMGEFLKQTQTTFWSVNMGRPPAHDPVKETEYMMTASLADAEPDGTIDLLVSTYQSDNDRVVAGLSGRGPRIITFAPILYLDALPLNKLLRMLLKRCEETLGAKVEIEFAVTLPEHRDQPARLGFLQVRPMMVTQAQVDLPEPEMRASNVVAASEMVLGNGTNRGIWDIVYLKPVELTEPLAWRIASELGEYNARMVAEHKPYLLIAFGRLGTVDPPFGIPVAWAQISGARVIVEAAMPGRPVELSQGSHFFHNLIAAQTGYFSVAHEGEYPINWTWIESQGTVSETEYIRHVKTSGPLVVKIDGRSGRGVIAYESA
jgi:hypothetical protein